MYALANAMVDARRLLARMSPGTQQLQRGFGNDPNALCQADVSLAAGRIRDPLTYRWIIYRYGGHDTERDWQRLVTSIVCELSRWAVQERWRMRGGGLGTGRLQRFAQLWITETAHPHRCRRCKGSGEAFSADEHRMMLCPQCGGSGVTQWSNQQRARWMGIRHSAWQKTWQDRYGRLGQHMNAKEAHGLRIVSLSLSDPLD